jgi:hypothetical protein
MCVAHINLYDHYANITKKEILMCVLSPHVGMAIEEEKSNVNFEPPCMYCKKGKKIWCVF